MRLHRTLLAAALALAPLAAWSQVSLSLTIAPPPLPVYAQPPIPDDGYLWTPGYWAWDPDRRDYVWVPGTWVLPPEAGLLWTPGYWGFLNGVYIWHRGYWGRQVGYYGGLNYGYGYTGSGYLGGRWDRDHFRYNSAVNNIPSGRVHDVYRAPVPQRTRPVDSFSGGPSHHRAVPTPGERRFEAAPHRDPTREQAEHERRSIAIPEQRMGNNHGRPPTAATPRPGGFNDPQVEHVRQAPAGPAHPAPQMRVQPVRPNPGMARPEGNPGGGRPQGPPAGRPGERQGERPGEHHGRPEGDRR